MTTTDSYFPPSTKCPVPGVLSPPQTQIYTVVCCPRPPATHSPRPPYLSPRRPVVNPRLKYDAYEFHACESGSVALVPGSLRPSAVSWDPKIKVWD